MGTFAAAHTTFPTFNTHLHVHTHLHIYPPSSIPYMCTYNHLCVSCCFAFAVCKRELKAEIDSLEPDSAGPYIGLHQHSPPPPPTIQTAGWLITPPPLPSAHRWDVRLKVDGEQHGVWCYTPSYRLEFGLQTAPPPPLPRCLTRFVSFRYPSIAADAICHCRAEDSFKKRVEGVFSGFEWFMKYWCVLMVLWFYSVLLKEYQSLQSCQSKPHWTEGPHTCNSALCHCFHSSWSHLYVIDKSCRKK